jgi:hypothetical protein
MCDMKSEHDEGVLAQHLHMDHAPLAGDRDASAWPRRSLGVYKALSSACVGTTEASDPGTLLVSASSIQNERHTWFPISECADVLS